MTDYEYELMQEALRRHLKDSHGYHGVKKKKKKKKKKGRFQRGKKGGYVDVETVP